jgi:sugar phosphate isomerase/epimerase
MKLSCLPVSLFGDIVRGELSIEQWASMASSLGLDGIDMSVLFIRSLDSAYLKKLRRGVEKEGTGVVVLNTYPDLTHPDRDERSLQLSQLVAHIEAAWLLGAEMVRVTAGQDHPEVSRTEGVEWAVAGLKEAADKAETVGVTPVYENHSKPGVWDYADFSYASDIFLDIVDRLRDTSMKILFDTANPVSRGEKPIPILERVVHRLGCVHVADTASKEELAPVLLGTGLVPLRHIFSFLKMSGYEGWLSIEEASGLGTKGIEEAVSFVRNEWKNC